MTTKTVEDLDKSPAPWGLPNIITRSICLFAGREASASLRIALRGLRDHDGENAAHEATYYEPFTYWDWHGVALDDTYAREYKRQRVWEHHRGFEVDGVAYGYPTPRERWEAFKKNVEGKVVDPGWVKKIAVAHWMDMIDLEWILTNLPQLKDLDLSDAPTGKTGEQHPWTDLLAAPWDLSKITWLGVPDFRNSTGQFALGLIQVFIKRCTSLSTLSIRGRESETEPVNAHDHICKLPCMIAKHVPQSVMTLELRLSYPYLDRLADALKVKKSPIRRIGIDLGALIQEYPKKPTSLNELKEDAIEKAATFAAQKARFEAYEKAHNETLGAGEKRILQESQVDQTLEQDYLEHTTHAFEHDCYAQESGSIPVSFDWSPQSGGSKCPLDKKGYHEDNLYDYVDSREDSTLPQMLNSFYQFGRTHKHIELFALKPDWQQKSTNPLHPITLVQAGEPSDATPMSKVYQWLNSTFKWRPVFDWDSFISPNHKTAHEALLQHWNLDQKLKPETLLTTIATQFQLLTQAGIPIHILLGRRHPDKSSLYWGHPTSPPTPMEKYLRTLDFDLKPIAPLITTLSIIYDLRDPLSPDHPTTTPSPSTAPCPRPKCPWAKCTNCPFSVSSSYPSKSAQKMPTAKSSHMSSPPLPPTDHPTPPHDADVPTLPIALRNAAFAREAIAWQKFWGEHAPLFTALDTLNVRMPKAFDGTGSIRLAKLLDAAKGWGMRAWEDESALEDGGGGEFVRRCWVRREEAVVKEEEEEERVEELKREGEDVDEPYGFDDDMHVFGETYTDADGFRGPEGQVKFEREMDYTYSSALERSEEPVNDLSFSEDEGDVRELDKEELHKAVDRAEEAADLVVQLQASSTSAPKTMTGLGRKLDSVYGKRVGRIAQHVWRERMKGYVRELEDVDSSGSDVLRATRVELQARLAEFRAEDVFVEEEGMKNGIGLVKQERNFTAESLEKRRGDLDELNYLFESDADQPGEEPVRTDGPVKANESGEDDSFYGPASPATHEEPVNPVDAPLLHASPHAGAHMSSDLGDVLSALQTYGGALTHPYPPQQPTDEASFDVRESIEIDETQVAVTQAGSVTVESKTTVHIKKENSSAPITPDIGQASQGDEVKKLPPGKLHSSPPPPPKSEAKLATPPKVNESAGSGKGQPAVPHVEPKLPDVAPPKKPTSSKKSDEQPSPPARAASSHQKPASALEKSPAPPKKQTARKNPSTTSEEPAEPKKFAPPLKKTPRQASPKKPTAAKKAATVKAPTASPPPVRKSPTPKKTTKTILPADSPAESSISAPTKRATRRRKDPVLAELEGKDSTEIFTERRTRGTSTRSGTPASYKDAEDSEDDDEEEDGEGIKKGEGKVRAKSKGKGKRKADEEWGAGGRRKRGKKSE